MDSVREALRAQFRRVFARTHPEKPGRCPDCGDENVPSHRMRGRLDTTTEEILWSCSSCCAIEQRMAKSGKLTCYCDWCCERFHPVSPQRFCGKDCAWNYQRTSETRDLVHVTIGA